MKVDIVGSRRHGPQLSTHHDDDDDEQLRDLRFSDFFRHYAIIDQYR